MELAEDKNTPLDAASSRSAASAKIRLTPVCVSSKFPSTAKTATFCARWVAICRRCISLTP